MYGARAVWAGVLAGQNWNDFSHIILNIRASISGQMVSRTAQATVISWLVTLLISIVPVVTLFVTVIRIKPINIIAAVTISLVETSIIRVSIIATPTLTVIVTVTVIGRVICIKGLGLMTLLITLTLTFWRAGVLPPFVLYLLSANYKGSVFIGAKFLILVTPMHTVTITTIRLLPSIMIIGGSS